MTNRIKENLNRLPDLPGVYLHKDKLGQVIYVGKAISLKNRVRQYFQNSASKNAKTKALVSNIYDFEWITCSSEMEALVLENNLIKRYMPKYNVLLRDDKTYPYIVVTTSDDYPRVIKTRVIKNDGNKYFGPYTDVGAVNRMVEFLNQAFQLKRCNLNTFPKGFRPCLNYHIGVCPGVCLGNVDVTKYREKIDGILEFLKGKSSVLRKSLENKMRDASEKLAFEEAAQIRDLIKDMESLHQIQRVTMIKDEDLDMVLPLVTKNKFFVVLFPVRNGKLSGRETHELQANDGDTREELVSGFLKQYYSQWAEVPREILIEKPISEKEIIQEFLSRDDKHVRIFVPQRGVKKRLLDMARRDRDQLMKTINLKDKSSREKSDNLQSIMKTVLQKAKGKDTDKQKTSAHEGYRVEAYDISNTNGVDTVGAMVVFSGLYPVKKDYRRFKIRTANAHDDYGSLQEVIYRRFKRAQSGDKGFVKMPDIIFMDGGTGQVSAAKSVLEAMGIDIPIVGLAKDDSHRTRAMVFENGEEISLEQYPILFRYCGRIQEEVHRFAIEYHRKLRGKNSIGSVLDNIEGIGQIKRNALLGYFKSIDEIKKASEEELLKVKGITEKNARAIVDFFTK
ncbi:excinuclease ABC subunit UvrC [Eubacteriales bacterium KG127]